MLLFFKKEALPLLNLQLAFPFSPPRDFPAAEFVPAACNEEARAWLARPVTWPGLRLAIHGQPGTGKTHLLHAFAEQHGAVLPADGIVGLPGLPEQGALAIDDADRVGEPLALLHLLNAAAERRMPVLLAARAPPARWGATLPDLDSRLRAITAVGLGRPDDGLLRAVLARLIAQRQLVVEEAVQAYLLARLPRSCAALQEAAARLDRASLEAGRRVTRGIAAETVAAMDQIEDKSGSADAAHSPPEPGLL